VRWKNWLSIARNWQSLAATAKPAPADRTPLPKKALGKAASGGCLALRSYAIDPDIADQLWSISEQMTGESFSA
jgi:hypothetical protein